MSLIGLTVDPNTYDITILRGDDQIVRFTVTTSTGAAQDVTSWTFKFTVKSSPDDAIGSAIFQKATGGNGIALTTPLSGIVDVTLAAADTAAMAGRYYYDLEGTDTGGLIHTVRAGLFVVRKDVTTPGTSGQPSVAVPDFSGGLTIGAPIVSRAAPLYNEIIVDPRGSTGAYPSIQSAITYAKPHASASSPWTIRLLPGIYAVTTRIDATSCSYVNIKGAGAGQTIILRSVAQDDSGTGVRPCDPVIDLTNSTYCSIQDLTIEHDGTLTGTAHPAGIQMSNSVGFRGINMKVLLLAGYIGIECYNSALGADTDAVQMVLSACSIIVLGATSSGADTFYTGFADLRLYGCYFEMSTAQSGPDCFYQGNGSRVIAVGCEFVRRQSSGAGSGRSMVISPTVTSPISKFYAVGCRFYNDWTLGDLSAALADCLTFDINVSAGSAADYDITLEGCSIHYESGVLTTGRTFGGIQVGSGASGTVGTLRLNSTEIRDLAGSGATNRRDLTIIVSASGGVRQPKAVYINGGRIATWGYRSASGTPAVVHTAMGAHEPTADYQSGSATMNAGTPATATVTLPVAYPNMSTNVTDYTVILEVPTNPGTENFWITGKTNTQFVINSTLNGSTTVIRWLVKR